MAQFKKYRKKSVQEMAPITKEELERLGHDKILTMLREEGVSISAEDLNNGSPKAGDMIARNSKNRNDQWLVSKEFFEENYEPVDV